MSPSNTLELEGSVGNGTGGGTGTIVDVTPWCVVLTSPVTRTIDNCENNWTPGTNVTSANTDNTVYRQDQKSVKIVTAATHATAGILAKFGLPASLDLSGYQQVSFCFHNVQAVTNAGDLKLKLYSDAACTTEVESFDLPAIPSTAVWIPITLNKGSALSATVQGVALYAGGAVASRTYYIDNIIACKAATAADSLTHQLAHLQEHPRPMAQNDSASPNDHASEGWYGIQSINGRIIVLDSAHAVVAFYPAAQQSYWRTSETVALYKRETIKTAQATSDHRVPSRWCSESGTAGN